MPTDTERAVAEDQGVVEYGTAPRRPSPLSFNRKRVGLIAIGLIVATAIYYPFSPAGRQAANMRGAEALLPPIRQSLQSDVRFVNVQIGVYTGYEGSVIVHGEVASAKDLSALRQIVAARSIPYHVTWAVVVVPPSTTTTSSGVSQTRPATN
jgi:hypothetical protein